MCIAVWYSSSTFRARFSARNPTSKHPTAGAQFDTGAWRQRRSWDLRIEGSSGVLGGAEGAADLGLPGTLEAEPQLRNCQIQQFDQLDDIAIGEPVRHEQTWPREIDDGAVGSLVTPAAEGRIRRDLFLDQVDVEPAIDVQLQPTCCVGSGSPELNGTRPPTRPDSLRSSHRSRS